MAEEQDQEVTNEDIIADVEAALVAVEEPEITEEPAEIEPEPEEAPEEVPEAKQKALDSGWSDKDQFTGDPDTWVDYEEFNRRTPLFERIHDQGRVIKDLNKKLDAVIKWNKTVESKTREKVLSELKAEQRKAVEDGDTERYDEVEQQIDDLSKEEGLEIQEEQEETKPDLPEIPDCVQQFADRNEWFEKDQQMTRYMLSTVESLKSADPNLSLDDAIAQAETEVKELFASRLNPTNPKKDKPSTVMGKSQEKRPSKITSIKSLPREAQEVWHALKGSMTEEEYIKQYEAMQ